MSESQIELAVCNALARKNYFVVKLKDQAAFRDGSYRKGSSFQLTGVPDLVVYLENGVTVWLEVKKGLNGLSEAQKVYHEKLISLGHIVTVVKSPKEALDFLSQLV